MLDCTRFEQLHGSVLAPACAALGATSGVFLHFIHMPLRRDCVHRDAYLGDAPGSVDAYRAGYYELDPILAPGLQTMRSAKTEHGAFVTLISGFHGRSDASYYTNFLRRYDIGHILGIVMPVRTINRSELLCLGFHRVQGADGFADREVHLLRDLMPLMQTVLTNLAFRDAMHLNEQVEHAMADSVAGAGFVVLDEDLMVCHANQRGLAQLGLYRGAADVADNRRNVFGELRERLYRMPHAEARRQTFTIGIPSSGTGAVETIAVEAHMFQSFDGRPSYVLVTNSAEERCAIKAACTRAGLSERETEVARLVCAGQSNALIGRELGITFRTVENHLRSAYHKVGVHSRTQLVSHLLRLQ